MEKLDFDYIEGCTSVHPLTIIGMIEEGIISGEFNEETLSWMVRSNSEIVSELLTLRKLKTNFPSLVKYQREIILDQLSSDAYMSEAEDNIADVLCGIIL